MVNVHPPLEPASVREPKRYAEIFTVKLFGLKLKGLDLSHPLGPDTPAYPGHAKTAFWTHLSHAECKLRLGTQDEFPGYSVSGIVTCDHASTHLDAVCHMNPERPDLTIDQVALEDMITPGTWVDLSFVPPRSHITLAHLRMALDRAGIERVEPGSTFLYYTGVSEHFHDPFRFVTQYPGLDYEASNWILDQGVVNVMTDAPSTDNPADLSYPNHLSHGRRLVVHTELTANINKIPRHQGFYVLVMPLRWRGLSGSPVRAIALWEEDGRADARG
jgi:kynurenine formamidase